MGRKSKNRLRGRDHGSGGEFVGRIRGRNWKPLSPELEEVYNQIVKERQQKKNSPNDSSVIVERDSDLGGLLPRNVEPSYERLAWHHKNNFSDSAVFYVESEKTKVRIFYKDDSWGRFVRMVPHRENGSPCLHHLEMIVQAGELIYFAVPFDINRSDSIKNSTKNFPSLYNLDWIQGRDSGLSQLRAIERVAQEARRSISQHLGKKIDLN